MRKYTDTNAFDIICLIGGIILMVALAMLLSGCTQTKWSNGSESFSRISLGTKLAAQKISVTVNTNGTRTMSIEGYQSDGVQAIGVAVDAAVSAAVKSVKP